MDNRKPLTADELETLVSLLECVVATAPDVTDDRDAAAALRQSAALVLRWADDRAERLERQQNEAEAARLHEWLEAVGGRP